MNTTQEITERPWGYWRVLYEVPGMKVKELTVNPGCQLSMQKHHHRSEYWIVSEGKCEAYLYHPVNCEYTVVTLWPHNDTKIKKDSWHQLRNPFDQPCRIVEIQYGTLCEESDIVRQV